MAATFGQFPANFRFSAALGGRWHVTGRRWHVTCETWFLALALLDSTTGNFTVQTLLFRSPSLKSSLSIFWAVSLSHKFNQNTFQLLSWRFCRWHTGTPSCGEGVTDPGSCDETPKQTFHYISYSSRVGFVWVNSPVGSLLGQAQIPAFALLQCSAVQCSAVH